MKDRASCMGLSRIWEPIFVPHDCLAASYIYAASPSVVFFFHAKGFNFRTALCGFLMSLGHRR